MSIDLSQINLPSFKELQIALDRAECRESLAEFVKRSWHILEPSTQLRWGWAMDAICEHLEAVTDGRIKRLCINVPPGFMKSLLTSVFWPAWEWGPANKPHMRYIGTSHVKDLAIRDATKTRTLIESEWYQERWPLNLKDDQNAKSNFANKHEGFREAAAFTKMTGKRGDRVILDDPIGAHDANSPAELLSAERAFMETLPTRVNDEDSAIIVIMQRLHERDVTGIILEEELEYTHLMLPMRFEAERRCYTDIGFVDPRKNDGELLFPEFFSEERVNTLEKSLREFGTAGQLQQRPIPRDGGMFKREWFEDKFIGAMPNDVVWARGYDLAAGTKKTNDPTASVKIGLTTDNRVIIAHVNNERLSPNAVRALVKQNAESDGTHVRISIPRDPGQASFTQVEQYRQDLIGYDVRFSPETGDKAMRATPLAAQAEAGGVYLVKGDWNAEFLDQICNFPNAKHDDMVDAASRAFSEVLQMVRKPKPKISTFGGRIVR